jgi:hypothetical protein
MRPNGGSTTDATTASAASATRVDPAFVAEAGRGCHIALDATATSWHLGCEAVDPDEYSDDAVFPDVAIDFDQGARSSSARLSVTNVGDGDCVKVAYVTVYETKCVGRNGQELEQGVTIDNGGGRSNVTTFIALVPPNAFLHLCRLKLKKGEDVRSVRIDNDVRPWSMHPEPNDTHARSVGFPLRGERFLCTQSEGGELTHFFSGNLHAVDFRCDVGTPVLAVGDGEVVEVNDSNTLTGIAVGNLFKWNSIVLKLDEEDSSSARAAGATSSTGGWRRRELDRRALRGQGWRFIRRVRARRAQELASQSRRPRHAGTSHLFKRVGGFQPGTALTLHRVSFERGDGEHGSRALRAGVRQIGIGEIRSARGRVLQRKRSSRRRVRVEIAIFVILNYGGAS